MMQYFPTMLVKWGNTQDRMKIPKPLMLGCLLLYAATGSAQTKTACSGTVYRSADQLLSLQSTTKSLLQCDEAAALDFKNWSCKSKVEQLLNKHASAGSFHAELMVLIDCNGKVTDAKILQTSDALITKELLPIIKGSTGNKTAKSKGKAVSGYAIAYLVSQGNAIMNNPLFVNQ